MFKEQRTTRTGFCGANQTVSTASLFGAGGVRDRNAQVVAGRDPDFIQINHRIDLTISLRGLPNVMLAMLMS